MNIIIYSIPHPNTLAFIYSDGDIMHRKNFKQNVFNIMKDYKNKNQRNNMIHTIGQYEFYKQNNN